MLWVDDVWKMLAADALLLELEQSVGIEEREESANDDD